MRKDLLLRVLYFCGHKTAPFMARIELGRPSIQLLGLQKLQALARGASFLAIIFMALAGAGFADEFSDLIIPKPAESVLVEQEDGSASSSIVGKRVAWVYLSQLDQDALEGVYAKYLTGLGFQYRKDKEIRKMDSRRLRFDRKDLVVDISMIDMQDEGTIVSITKHLASGLMLDTQDIASPSPKLPLVLPEHPKEEPKFKPMPFKPGEEVGPAQHPSDAGELDIPAPPQGELLDENPPEILMGKDGKGRFYYSGSSLQEVEKFYRQFFRRQGFTYRKDKEASMINIKRLRFEGRSSAAEIFLIIKESGCNVGIIQYPTRDGAAPLEKDPLKEISFPVEDAPGQDLANVPRPPQSSRCIVRSGNGEVFIGYLAKISPEEVRQFYEEKMPDLNWELVRDLDIRKELETHKKEVERDKVVRQVKIGESVDLGAIVADSYTLDFKSNSSTVRITIYSSFLEKNPGTMVNIIYAGAGGA